MKTFLLLASLILFNGCSTRSSTPKYATLKPYTEQTDNEVPYKLQKHNPITQTIYEQYKKWYNTPYEYGGNSCHGIDCSALVQNVYEDGFGVTIPRDTTHQAKAGHFIKKSAIKEGDLVLFKTSYRSKHSGIYLEYGNFLHTSTKHGVVISNINNPYWKQHYWQARRVLAY
ncbi:C40 family peptidase [Sulfurimonas sp.]|uniref:C40 family peptidase n=1 Tax=Sulfurimonas sp. TaxID=2022749 RepID=UPI003D13F5CC